MPQCHDPSARLLRLFEARMRFTAFDYLALPMRFDDRGSDNHLKFTVVIIKIENSL